MKYTVITGATGYVGRALTKRLAQEGRALRLVSRSTATNTIDLCATFESVQADLCDVESWLLLLENADAVIHLAARTSLLAAESDPAGDHELNVAPIYALIEAARRCNLGIPVIFASTVTIVGIQHSNPVSETAPDRPCSVYDRHKLECETILRNATHKGVIRACSLRLSNVYGYSRDVTPSVNAHRGVLNTNLGRAWRGEPLRVYGDGNYIRDFIFIEDVVEAFYRALESEQLCDGSQYIIATGMGHTISEAYNLVAQKAYQICHRQPEIRYIAEPPNIHPIERRHFVGDSRLFHKLSGWRAEVDLASGIATSFTSMLYQLPQCQGL